jgi:hypothetical protein
MTPVKTQSVPLVTTSAEGTTATVRQIGERRFRLHLKYDHSPQFVRVLLAVSLGHLAELLREHVPAACVRDISNAVARAVAA